MTVLDLWGASPAQQCPQSCHCVVPENCRWLTPYDHDVEVLKRRAAGFVESHEDRHGLDVVTYRKEQP